MKNEVEKVEWKMASFRRGAAGLVLGAIYLLLLERMKNNESVKLRIMTFVAAALRSLIFAPR
jgi:hypothetical protein